MKVTIVCGDDQVEISEVDPAVVEVAELAALARDLMREVRSIEPAKRTAMGFAIHGGSTEGMNAGG